MTNVSVYKIFNETDKDDFTMYVEWHDSHFKIILLKSKVTPLVGEMSLENINYFSKELSKSSNEYLLETKEAFCGKQTDIRFYIGDETFTWRTYTWTLGKIKLCAVSNSEILSECFLQLLNSHQCMEKKLATLEIENERLKSSKTELNAAVECMAIMKITMEQDLYKRFHLILNEKKKKLKKLQDTLKENTSTKESIFDMCTDESESSDNEIVDERNNLVFRSRYQRRKLKKKKNKMLQETKRIKSKRNEHYDIDTAENPKASTSKASIDETNNHLKLNNENIVNEVHEAQTNNYSSLYYLEELSDQS